MNINILKNGTSAFTRDISVGGNRYTETIQRELNLSFQDADNAKIVENPADVNPEALDAVINTVNAEVAGEITRSIDYYRSTAAQESLDKVLLCGGGARIRGLIPALEERLGLTVELVDPFSKIEVDQKMFDLDMIHEIGPQAAVGVGLAIRRMGDR